MKIHKWTLGLAAVGLVSLAANLQAQLTPAPASPVMTALSATTISGYVDTSAVWNPGTGNNNPAPFAFNAGKQDGFNLDQIDLKISKPLDEAQWSAGYTVEISLGPDAIAIDGGAYPIRQAYIALRAPVGNGLDFQIGRFDNPVVYESSDSYKDPNWTRSYGYTFSPTDYTGVQAAYKFCDAFSAQAGLVDVLSQAVAVNARNFNGGGFSTIESSKAIIGLLTLTAPDSWGFLKGSALYAGADYGPAFGANHTFTHDVDMEVAYVGATVNTPLKDLTVGAVYDSINGMDLPTGLPAGYAMAASTYVNYKITDKLSINGRGEYAHGSDLVGFLAFPSVSPGATIPGGSTDPKVLALTGTLQYDLWANVISRLEIRWDHSMDGTDHFGGTPYTTANGFTGGTAVKKNDVLIAANIIYKF